MLVNSDGAFSSCLTYNQDASSIFERKEENEKCYTRH